MKLLIQLSLVAATGALLVGCETPPGYGASGSKTGSTPTVAAKPEAIQGATPSAPTPAPVAAPPVVVAAEPSASEKALAAGLSSFERGEYVAAMRQLSPLTTDSSLDVPSRLRALKSLAFSQCLTGAVVACRGTFERAFKLDSKFDLAPAEQGHPVWGPQFDRARKNVKVN